jgi:cytochrome b561
VRPRLLIVLHWATVLVLSIGVASILIREETEGRAARAWLLEIHRTCGLLVLLLCTARLWTRWRSGILADLVPSQSRYLRAGARCVHALLYVLLMSIPLLGWTLSSLDDQKIRFFGVQLPALSAPDEDASDSVRAWHTNTAIALGVLAAVHAGAALWHHFVKRDPVLQAMWLRRR